MVRPSREEISRYVADFIIARLSAFEPTAQRPYFVLGLPTGSSPELVYASLVTAYKTGQVSFHHVVTFNMVPAMSPYDSSLTSSG